MGLDQDMKLITANKNPCVNNMSWGLVLHTKNKDIPMKQMLSVDIKKDYINSYADLIMVNAEVGTGDYMYDIEPFSNNLEATLTFVGSGVTYHNLRYKCIIRNNTAGARNTAYGKASRSDLNKLSMVTLNMQLVLKEAEAIRTLYVDGIYSYETVGNILKAEWKDKVGKVKLGGKPIDLDIDIAEPNNTRKYTHVIIPAGVELTKLIYALQNGQYGVYNGMISNYITYFNNKFYLFIYPLYDYERYDKAKKRLTIYKSNTPAYNYNENTYSIDSNGNVKIIADTRTEIIDDGENVMMTDGVGLIQSFSDVQGYRDVAVSDKDAKVVGNNHMRVQSPGTREDGVLKAKYVGNSDNMYSQRSFVNKQMMQIITIQWNFSHPFTLIPGMPVSFLSEYHGEVIERKGVLLHEYHVYSKVNNTITSKIVIAVYKANISIPQEGPVESKPEENSVTSIFGNNTVVSDFKSGIDNVKSTISTIDNNIASGINTVKSEVENITNKVTSTINNVKNGIESTINNVKTTIDTTINNVKSNIDTAVNSAKDAAITKAKETAKQLGKSTGLF